MLIAYINGIRLGSTVLVHSTSHSSVGDSLKSTL